MFIQLVQKENELKATLTVCGTGVWVIFLEIELIGLCPQECLILLTMMTTLFVEVVLRENKQTLGSLGPKE